MYHDARLVVFEEFLAVGWASEAEFERQRHLVRVARETAGYRSDSPGREGCNSEDINRLDSSSWISKTYQPGDGNGPDDDQVGRDGRSGKGS